jgi:pilus assembly protein CpaE
MNGTPALSGEEFGRFLDVVRGLFALVVVAADMSLPVGALGAAVQRAGQTIVLGDASILHSRSNQQLMRLLRQANVPLERAALVVDRPQRSGVEPAKLADLLQLPLLTLLGGDAASRLQAMNSGESLFKIAPRDEYATGVKRLAQQLIERRAAPAEAETRRGLLEKLFG